MQPTIWRLRCQNLWQVCLLTLLGYSHKAIISRQLQLRKQPLCKHQ